jgi:cytochrome c-type biogenesis protein CcmH/NrfG
MRRNLFIGLLLAGITLAIYWPARNYGIVNFDDPLIVTENAEIQSGLNWHSLWWALSGVLLANWHPVTSLSFVLDHHFFGTNPGVEHVVNVLFHAANAALLFLVLQRMTHFAWRSAMVAALFAWHPLRVESVAWISERKDVLSGFFFLLTLLMYAQYVEKSKVQSPRSKVFFGLSLGFFALGLMSKPMLVTLPVILLLLDFWPLKRVAGDEWRVTRFGLPVPQPSTLNRLLFEKTPFLALSVASSIVTFWAQYKGGAVISVESMPWYVRVFHPLTAYSAYLGKILWPENLAVFYPYTPMHHLWELVCSILLPVVVSVFCLRRARFQPGLLVGWFWFLVMLVPVIGLVQVGLQSIADRYTYLPSIGLFIIVAWGMAGIAAISTLWRTVMTLGAAGLLLACLLGTRNQLGYWQDSIRLFSHSIEVTRENNFKGYILLGNSYVESGNLNDAAESYQSALRINSNFEEAHSQLGCVLLVQKKFQAAGVQFGEVLRLNPHDADAHKHLGDALAGQDKTTEAEAEYTTALQLKPDDVETREGLALILARKGETDKALACLQEALKIQPTPGAHAQVASLRAIQGGFQDAVQHYLEALRLKPDSPDVLNNLAWLLATCPDPKVRDGTQAVQLAQHACELTDYKQTIMIGTLAAAYAEAGRFDDAISMAQKACTLALAVGDQGLLQKNQELLVLYQKHQPYHEPLEKLVPAAP